ncbi:hypothetical protein HDU93_006438, partial [Gonapodya sp. JEL0774]
AYNTAVETPTEVPVEYTLSVGNSFETDMIFDSDMASLSNLHKSAGGRGKDGMISPAIDGVSSRLCEEPDGDGDDLSERDSSSDQYEPIAETT